MANLAQALTITLKNEGGFMHDPATGECSNYGISHWFLRQIGVLDRSLGDAKALPYEVAWMRSLSLERATELYEHYFWTAHRLGEIRDDRLAAKVFDLTVNMGPGSHAHSGAIVLLQEAVNSLRGKQLLATDGKCGPQTIREVNYTHAGALLDRLRDLAVLRYRAIAQSNPLKARYLAVWLKRATA